MKDLETRLREIPLREPSRDLDDRVIGSSRRRITRVPVFRRRVPAWSAVAAAVLLAALGFLAGAKWTGDGRGDPGSGQPMLRVHVIHSSPGRPNPYDFTRPSPDFVDGEWKAETRILKGAKT